MPLHQLHRCESFQSRHIAAAGHHHVGLSAAVVARPFPYANPSSAVLDCLVHVKPLRRRLFAGDDDIHIVAATKTVIRNRKQAVRVRR